MTLHVACEPFATVEDFLDFPCACTLTEDDSGLIEDLLDEASDVLSLVTGGVVRGRCTQTYRPCRRGCQCGAFCSCHLDAIYLPGIDPVVDEVRIDGEVLAPSEYAVMNGSHLIRVSTDRTPPSWPARQDLWKPTTEAGTWSVKVTSGVHLEEMARQAAVELACHMASTRGKKRNALAPNAVGAQIGGASIQLQRQADSIKEGMGAADLPRIARFVAAYTPSGPVPATVWSPDVVDYDLHVVS